MTALSAMPVKSPHAWKVNMYLLSREMYLHREFRRPRYPGGQQREQVGDSRSTVGSRSHMLHAARGEEAVKEIV